MLKIFFYIQGRRDISRLPARGTVAKFNRVEIKSADLYDSMMNGKLLSQY